MMRMQPMRPATSSLSPHRRGRTCMDLNDRKSKWCMDAAAEILLVSDQTPTQGSGRSCARLKSILKACGLNPICERVGNAA